MWGFVRRWLSAVIEADKSLHVSHMEVTNAINEGKGMRELIGSFVEK